MKKAKLVKQGLKNLNKEQLNSIESITNDLLAIQKAEIKKTKRRKKN